MREISLKSFLECGRQSLNSCYFRNCSVPRSPNFCAPESAEQLCRSWLVMVDKSGDETGYPAQQSKIAYIQEHLTNIIEGVNKRGNP